MNAIVPASRRTKSRRPPPSGTSEFSITGSELNGADGETLSGAIAKAEDADWRIPCFSFFASEMTGRQAILLLEFWRQIIREK